MSKDAGLRIRIERELREKFLEACRSDDVSAAQVLRAFIRDYVQARRQPTETPESAGRSPARPKGRSPRA